MANYAEPETKSPMALMELPPDLLTTFEESAAPGKEAVTAFRLKMLLEMSIMADYKTPVLDGALKVANAVRAAIGLPPAPRLLPGKKGDGQHCVIAATILDGYDGSKGSVGVSGTRSTVGGVSVKHPPEVVKFINQFDHGQLPDFDVEAK